MNAQASVTVDLKGAAAGTTHRIKTLSQLGPDPLFTRADWRAFLTVEGLCRRGGVGAGRLRRLVLRELVDNGIDASGLPVEYGELEGGGYYVEDFGPGLAPELVPDLFSVSRPQLSSKLWRKPARGALGNGLRVVAGGVAASDGRLRVVTRGIAAGLKIDPATGCAYVVDTEQAPATAGTRVELWLGEETPDEDDDPFAWAQLSNRLATNDGYRGRSSPHWYDVPSFHELLLSAGEMQVRAFVSHLDGCTGGRAGKITNTAALAGRLCESVTRDEAERLLDEACEAAKPVRPERLVWVGRAAIDDDGRSYVRAALDVQMGRAAIPALLEVWAVAAEGEVTVNLTINRSPVTAETILYRHGQELQLFLPGMDRGYRLGRKQTAVDLYVNLTAPFVPFVSDGKEPDLTEFGDVIANLCARALRNVRATTTPRDASSIKASIQSVLLAELGVERRVTEESEPVAAEIRRRVGRLRRTLPAMVRDGLDKNDRDSWRAEVEKISEHLRAS